MKRVLNYEREAVVTAPPVLRPTAVPAEPVAFVTTVRPEQNRVDIGADIVPLMHHDDPQQMHRFYLAIREPLTDEASHFGVGLAELAPVGLLSNLARDPVAVLKEHALEDGHLGRHSAGRLEGVVTKHSLGVEAADAELLAFQARDPVLAGRAVARDREVDDAVFFAPGAGRFGHDELAAEEPLDAIHATEPVDDRFDATK